MDGLPMRATALLPVALLVALAASPAGAALVKCADDRGAVIYQDTACPPGKELRDLEAHPATLSVVPGTPVPSATATAKTSRSVRPTATRVAAHRNKPGNPAERRFIHNGMSEAEVILRIGRPDVRTKGHGKAGGTRWSYLPSAGDADTLTTLTLAGGKVIDVERRVAR
jgi:hypothetical protein